MSGSRGRGERLYASPDAPSWSFGGGEGESTLLARCKWMRNVRPGLSLSMSLCLYSSADSTARLLTAVGCAPGGRDGEGKCKGESGRG